MANRVGRGLGRLLTLTVLTGLSSGCSSIGDETSPGAGATGSGGSGSSYMPATCDQGCRDYLVAWALQDTIWFLWNQKLAGHPVGAQDIVGSCPLGGTVHITGSDDVADGTTTTDLVFQLDDCQNSQKLYSLTFTGSVSLEGSFNRETSFTAEVFSVAPLTVSGSLEWLDNPSIDESCDVMFSEQRGGADTSLSGRACGRDFNESSLQTSGGGMSGQGGGGGTAGSGTAGSSTAGTAGSDCSCYCPDGSDCTGAKGSNPCGVDADGIPEPCACPVDCR